MRSLKLALLLAVVQRPVKFSTTRDDREEWEVCGDPTWYAPRQPEKWQSAGKRRKPRVK